ncbi:TetR/AcrR family transcriptional regulator [Amycolatopsis sp. NPDC101161]|uniref:TetR/AcrR family transcriptional regulator n=1 Tax=Amycolatopsis sp. NPDC101161 TaxID=3363940 RepID=UPI0037FE6194
MPRGVADTTLEDVKATANVSGSQLHHYFPDKDDLVQAVSDYEADAAVNSRRQADFGNIGRRRAWRG